METGQGSVDDRKLTLLFARDLAARQQLVVRPWHITSPQLQKRQFPTIAGVWTVHRTDVHLRRNGPQMLSRCLPVVRQGNASHVGDASLLPIGLELTRLSVAEQLLMQHNAAHPASPGYAKCSTRRKEQPYGP